MPKPISRSIEFSTLLFSLLRYYENGNHQTFSSIVNRVVDYFGFSLKEADRSYLSRLLADRLNVFGLIHKYRSQGQQGWSLLGECLVKLGPSTYLVFGGIEFLSKAHAAIDEEAWSAHEIYPIPGTLIKDLSLTIPVVEISDADARAVSLSLGTTTKSDEYRYLLQLIPMIDAVIDQVVEVDAAQHLIGTTEIQKYDFQKNRWLDSSPETTRAGGYFRVPHEHGLHTYVVFRRLAGSLISYSTSDSDWTYLIACRLLRQKLKWEYDAIKNTLSVPRSSFGRLPTVVRKGLCLRNFMWPEIGPSHYMFSEIPRNDVDVLCSRLEIIEV